MMNRYYGFSLVELLTALVISTLIILGIGQAFISQKVSYKTQNGLSRVQQTGRFAIDYLAKDLRMAGFPGRSEQASNTFNAIIPELTADGGGSSSDSVTVMYQTTVDCLGNNTPPAYTDGNRYAKNQYSIVNGNLVCSTYGEVLASPAVPLATAVLARGVQNMQILYAVGSQFVSAATITTGGDWANVTSMRVSFLVNSVDRVTEDVDTNTYALLNADQLGPFNDNLRRRVFTTTVAMRNRLDLVQL